jgi:uncharacterized protein YbaR (Trm112 family)
MAVLDLVACPICKARDSLVRQTTELESRSHVTYECLQCGTLLVWLGDDMWLEADRWSFQKVGRPERADLLYRSMTVAELRKLAGEKPPRSVAGAEQESGQAAPPLTWVEITPVEDDEPGAAPLAASGMAMAAGARGEAGHAATGEEWLEEPPAEAVEEVQPVEAAPAIVEEEGAARDAVPQDPPAKAGAEAAVVGAALIAQEEPARDAVPQERRSQGSPFLVISVGLVLLCLICSAAAMIVYSTWSNWPGGAAPPTNPPASEAMPTETAAPTNTPAPTATPSAMPTEEAGVEFQGVTDYLSSTGSHYLVGEVLNRTGDTLRFIEVLATFYDADGQLVSTGSTFTELSIIEPGSTAPFKLTTLNPPALGHYDLRVDYSTTTQPPIRLEIIGHSGSAADSGWYHVTGEVRNPHDFAIKFPEIVATYYNATHEVIRVGIAFGEQDPLQPGQSSPFEVVLTDPPADLQHYALQTEAVQQ